jgi:hypothetical protein
MRSLSPAAITVLASDRVTFVQLLLMQFPSALLAFNTSNRNIDLNGVLYLGAAGLGAISEIPDAPGEVKGIQFEISGVSSAAIALALDSANEVQGTPVDVRTGILDAGGNLVDAPVDWAGKLDTMSITETGSTCTITVTAESTAVDLLRRAPLTYSNADQQARYPGDRAFEYSVAQASTPVVWPTRQWFIDKGQR